VRLGTQLLWLGLSALSLPWAAWVFVGELERLLREGQEQSQQEVARTLAAALAITVPTLDAPRAGLYVLPSAQPPILDGFATDWDPSLAAHSLDGAGRLRLRLQAVDQRLFVWVAVQDHTPERSQGNASDVAWSDHVQLDVQSQGRWETFVVPRVAPGVLRVHSLQGTEVRGAWQEQSDGYAMELALPVALSPQAIRLTAMDVDGVRREQIGSGIAQPLMQPLPALSAALRSLLPEARWVRVFDPQQRLLAQAGSLPEDVAVSPWRRWLSETLGGDALAIDAEAPTAVESRWAALGRGESQHVWRLRGGCPAVGPGNLDASAFGQWRTHRRTGHAVGQRCVAVGRSRPIPPVADHLACSSDGGPDPAAVLGTIECAHPASASTGRAGSVARRAR
jgi:hypothetical protein